MHDISNVKIKKIHKHFDKVVYDLQYFFFALINLHMVLNNQPSEPTFTVYSSN